MPDVFCPVSYHVADVSRAVSLLAGVQAAWELRLSDLSVESFDDMNVINFRQIFADREFEPGMLQLEVSFGCRRSRGRRDGQGGGGAECGVVSARRKELEEVFMKRRRVRSACWRCWYRAGVAS